MAPLDRPNRLENGDRFPDLGVGLVGGGTLRLPDDASSGWTVLVIYRGHW
jgi:hypothetical protein